MNPLKTTQNDPMDELTRTLNGGASIQQIGESILSSNPQASSFLNAMKVKCGNGDPKQFVLGLCAQNGINNEKIMQLANLLGLK